MGPPADPARHEAPAGRHACPRTGLPAGLPASLLPWRCVLEPQLPWPLPSCYCSGRYRRLCPPSPLSSVALCSKGAAASGARRGARHRIFGAAASDYSSLSEYEGYKSDGYSRHYERNLLRLVK